MAQRFTVAPIFSNHMVLQRDKEIRVWGEGKDNDVITVSLEGQTVSVIVKEQKWMAILPSRKAGGPARLNITCEDEMVEYTDILIGDVWLAGGQSNMELQLVNSKDGKRAVEEANYPNIRIYNSLQQSFLDENALEAERNNAWHICNSSTDYDAVANITAVGYYFAKELNQELDVPIGIVGCNWGGTSASAWISKEYLEKDSDTRIYLEDYEEAMKKYASVDDYDKAREQNIVDYDRWKKISDKLYQERPDIVWGEVLEIAGECPYPEPLGPKSPFRACGLYETMLSRIVPLSLKGFIYYQGESDDHRPTTYAKLLTMLIDQWRHDFKDYELPFLFVQLPMYIPRGEVDHKHWPVIREAQMKVHKTIKNTGLAVALDLGEFNNIHPLDKESVGNRLALQALFHVYGKDINPYGPIFKSLLRQENEIVLEFNNAEDGLVLDGDEVNGFEVAGDNEVFVKATARIEADKIIVKADEIENPMHVRYQWTNFDKVSIFNKNGLPLAPFRSNEL
ncbi:sialate O-acetylesterase [Anaeromicropila herbilytica]|uniref:9-O-acetylesterase n=1 Tax=Anaeromicropila herbilytica TaxID=2785025 RepID=A0A7R7ICX4_9FIRM|nr:sialate O-acetylesterase [Anaeromicropila herbilytica]BCN30306.1 9-O-acetylesterase [Anaeromicropila herbilytica]